MSETPMSTTLILESLIKCDGLCEGRLTIEAEAAWFPKPTREDPYATESGEAQAIITLGDKRYAISLEPLP